MRIKIALYELTAKDTEAGNERGGVERDRERQEYKERDPALICR